MITLPEDIEKATWSVEDAEEHLRFMKAAAEIDRAREVKSSRHRTVIRVSDYYVKIFHHGNPSGRLKLLFHNMPFREWENATKLYRATGLTAKPISFGKSAECSFFVSKSLEPCQSVATLISSNWGGLNSGQKMIVMDKFLDFLERLKSSGFFQPDFHLDNILVKGSKAPNFNFFIVDLHRARLGNAALTPSMWAEQLTYILPCFDFLSYWELRRFWIVLKKRHPEMVSHYPYILKKSYARMSNHWCKKEKRLRFDANKIKYGKFAGYVKSENLAEEIKKLLMTEPEKLFTFGTHTYKDSRSAKISIVEINGEKYIFKRHNRRGRLHTLKYIFRASRAISHWKKSIKFSMRNLPTPEILAAFEERKHGFLERSYVLLRMVGTGANSFSGHLVCLKEDPVFYLRRLTLVLWEMHQRGIFHGDAKLSNFIPDPQVPKYMYHIVDLDGSKFKKSVHALERISDLADFASSVAFLNIAPNAPEIIFNYYFSLGRFKHENLVLKKKLFHYLVLKKVRHKEKRQGKPNR